MKWMAWISANLRKRRHHAGPAARSGGSAGGGGFFVQFWAGHVHGADLTLVGIGLLALTLALAAIAVQLLAHFAPRWRSSLRIRRYRRRRRLAAANVERRTRALMSELCPQGWRAQITLLGPGDDAPPEAGPARVALDWAEIEDESGRAAVVRRVWAPTIAEALEAMVADRQTDETLEQIERAAAADGTPWPDLYL